MKRAIKKNTKGGKRVGSGRNKPTEHKANLCQRFQPPQSWILRTEGKGGISDASGITPQPKKTALPCAGLFIVLYLYIVFGLFNQFMLQTLTLLN